MPGCFTGGAATGDLNYYPIAAEYSFRRRECRDWPVFDERRIIAPTTGKAELLTRAIVVLQVGHIAEGVIRKPLIDTGNADLMEHAQRIPCRLPLILHDRWQQLFTHWGLVLLADFKRASVHVPLHRVAEQVPQQEEPLLGCQSEI